MGGSQDLSHTPPLVVAYQSQPVSLPARDLVKAEKGCCLGDVPAVHWRSSTEWGQQTSCFVGSRGRVQRRAGLTVEDRLVGLWQCGGAEATVEEAVVVP